MDLRHLRYFIAVAEEEHFGRAAERLHIEQSPVSRTIQDLESELGTKLFDRTTRSIRITWAGQVFLNGARQVFAMLEQATADAKAAALGYHGHLRIALSDGLAQPRLATLFAQCRKEEPDVEIRIFEMPFMQQLKGLRSGLLDAGFALASQVGEGVVALPIWTDPISAALPARHPLTEYKKVAMIDVLRFPLILSHPEAGSGCYLQVEAMMRAVDAQPNIADYATTLGVMMTLVGAGYGIGFGIAAQLETLQRPDVVIRPLSGRRQVLTTYLLRPQREPSAELTRFIARVRPSEVAPSVLPPTA